MIAYLPLLKRRLRAVQLGGVQVIEIEAEGRLQTQPERILNYDYEYEYILLPGKLRPANMEPLLRTYELIFIHTSYPITKY